MTAQFEEDGYLWEPGHEDARAPVRIAFDPEFGTRVTLIDAAWAGDAGASWHVLHGESLWAVPWTLFEVRSRPAEKAPWRSEHSRTKAAAWRLVTGGHFDTEGDVKLTMLHLQCHGLLEWLTQGRQGSDPALSKPDGAPADFWGSISADAHGVHAFFSVAATSGGGWYSQHTQTKASLQLESEQPLSLTSLVQDWVTPVQDLLLFATRRPTATISLSGLNSAAATAEGSPADIKILEAWPSLPTRPWTDYMGRNLLPANAVKDPGDLLKRWFILRAELGDAAELFFATLNNPTLPAVNRLLNVLAFAEDYHRRKHNEPPLTAEEHDTYKTQMLDQLPSAAERDIYKDRLGHANAQSQHQRVRWLIARAGDADDRLEEASRPLEKSLIATRNRLTHFDGDDQWITTTTFGYSVLAANLEYVLEANLLFDLGLEAESVAECLSHGHGSDDPIPELPHDQAPGRL